MGAILTFFSGPLQLKALLVVAGLALVSCLGLTAYGQYWRAEAKSAIGERDLAIAQGNVLAAAAKSCSAGVDQVKQVSNAAIATIGEMLARARKLAAPRERTIERIETVIHQAPKPGEGCEWAWDQIEAERKGRSKP
jgi:hypothetical protein